MKGQFNVKTPAEYIDAVDDKRRSDIAALDALIRKHAPKLEPVVMNGMLGCGPFHYRYASGREGDTCKTLDRQQQVVHLAVLRRRRREGLRRRAVRRPAAQGQHRQVVRAVKKLTDLDEMALVALIKETVKTGLAA